MSAILFAMLLAACGGDPCDDEKYIKCDDEVLLECVDGRWEEKRDCYAEDLVCVDSGEGYGRCLAESSGVM